jgi:glutaredoxin
MGTGLTGLDGAHFTRQYRSPMLGTLRIKLQDSLHRAITSPAGDGFAPVRIQKDLARRLNVMLGRPICSLEEAEQRRNARTRLSTLRTKKVVSPRQREAAPVLIYFEKDRNKREVDRVKETLEAKGYAYKLCDVTGDEATITFVMRKAQCEKDEMPIVFVADKPIGGFRAVVDADVSGELHKAIYGEPAPARA